MNIEKSSSFQVIEVRARRRTGDDSLVTTLRTTLEAHYPKKSLALGGTFIIQKGKAKIHIMVNPERDSDQVLESCSKSCALIYLSWLESLKAKRVLGVPPQHQR